jgi:hypothetical protein
VRSRLEVLAEQLRVDVLKVEPTAGSILVIRPGQGGHLFTYQYKIWLADELSKMLPAGVRTFVFDDPTVFVGKLEGCSPAPVSTDYAAGWEAAVAAIIDLIRESD